MIKYLKFALRFVYSSFYLKTTNYFGNLPFKSEPGTIYRVIGGGTFKYQELFIYSFNNKWLLIDSTEDEVKQSKEYQDYQCKIIEDLQSFKQNLDKPTKI